MFGSSGLGAIEQNPFRVRLNKNRVAALSIQSMEVNPCSRREIQEGTW